MHLPESNYRECDHLVSLRFHMLALVGFLACLSHLRAFAILLKHFGGKNTAWIESNVLFGNQSTANSPIRQPVMTLAKGSLTGSFPRVESNTVPSGRVPG